MQRQRHAQRATLSIRPALCSQDRCDTACSGRPGLHPTIVSSSNPINWLELQLLLRTDDILSSSHHNITMSSCPTITLITVSAPVVTGHRAAAGTSPTTPRQRYQQQQPLRRYLPVCQYRDHYQRSTTTTPPCLPFRPPPNRFHHEIQQQRLHKNLRGSLFGFTARDQQQQCPSTCVPLRLPK